MNTFRNRRQQFALWLALAAVFYRALIPVGLMPASARQLRDGAVLVLCSGGGFRAGSGEPGKAPHFYVNCEFAAAVASAPPPAPAPLLLPSAAPAPLLPPELRLAGTGRAALPPPARGPPLSC